MLIKVTCGFDYSQPIGCLEMGAHTRAGLSYVPDAEEKNCVVRQAVLSEPLSPPNSQFQQKEMGIWPGGDQSYPVKREHRVAGKVP